MFYRNNPWYRVVLFDAAGGAGGGADGGAVKVDLSNPEVKKLVDSAVETALAGIKKNRDDLLEEKKALEKNFEGLDPKTTRELMDRINADEDMKLFTSGKRQEYDERITGRMKASHENQIKAANDKIADLEKTLKDRSDKLSASLRNSAIQSAAAELGVLPTALPDIVSRASSIFSVDDNAAIVALDASGGVILGPDGKKPLTAKDWVKSLKETAPHLFPASKGGGSSGGGNGGTVQNGVDLSALPPQERLKIHRMNQAGRR